MVFKKFLNEKASSKIISTFLTISLLVLVFFSGPGKTYADVAVGIVGFGYGTPNDYPPRVCVQHRNVNIGMETGSGINPFDYRTSSYAFAGEQLEYTIVIRDPNGALDIGFPKIMVDGSPEVLCNEVSLPSSCNGMGDMNPDTDRAYHCLLTVEQSWYQEKDVKIVVYNSAFEPTDGTHIETWFFNPVLSYTVTTNDGQAIHFEEMPYGADTPEERTVHSLNRLKVKNTAEGGVNMWTYIAGTDLYDPNGASKCPTSNVLTIGNMQYRGWSGTQWTSWEGWTTMSKYNQDDSCSVFGTCYGGLPVPHSENQQKPLDHVLTNQGTLEVEFKLTYPMPCVGSFTQGSIMIFGKTI